MKKAQNLVKQIPYLKEVPEKDIVKVYQNGIRSAGFLSILMVILLLFLLLIYFHYDVLTHPDWVAGGSIKNKLISIMKELGVSFFLNLVILFFVLVQARNFFVKRAVNNYLNQHSSE